MTFLIKCPECGRVICKDKIEIRKGMFYCDHCKKSVYCSIGYLPDDPKNKVFAVDAYVTVCKCVKVEAPDEESAEKIVSDMICQDIYSQPSGEDTKALYELGFDTCEDDEVRVSGVANENGEIEYN